MTIGVMTRVSLNSQGELDSSPRKVLGRMKIFAIILTLSVGALNSLVIGQELVSGQSGETAAPTIVFRTFNSGAEPTNLFENLATWSPGGGRTFAVGGTREIASQFAELFDSCSLDAGLLEDQTVEGALRLFVQSVSSLSDDRFLWMISAPLAQPQMGLRVSDVLQREGEVSFSEFVAATLSGSDEDFLVVDTIVPGKADEVVSPLFPMPTDLGISIVPELKDADSGEEVFFVRFQFFNRSVR